MKAEWKHEVSIICITVGQMYQSADEAVTHAIDAVRKTTGALTGFLLDLGLTDWQLIFLAWAKLVPR